ncbi:hypothetical protein [Vitiosangium sp. GDMCC 1.1324]|uniref:hypothetical protein n=1 Tax=Vitiosangium sp. (strain GDMCC 1.1324) TaxID=2138576 RepID=UPI000D35B3C2|nr:hypothetical protein [Vitiosangium sp. GDMCC 1.1324]PTL81798.1 hypothetical protein DAT35_22940 [Vitiosangium sp. GDMCC 1.1324]
MRTLILSLGLLLALPAGAQTHAPGHEHEASSEPPASEPPASEPSTHGEHKAGHMGHPGGEPQEVRSLRDIPVMRRGSGTSWQPDLIPSSMLHWEVAGWGLMFQGVLFGGYDVQGGPRGDSALTGIGWLMLMADRELPSGQLVASLMLSPDPFTAGADGGYPLLLQTGESYKGEPLHDRQHPHDLFMELAASYTHYFSDTWGLMLYVAPAGEPALGPVAFPHRVSARYDPLAVLGHHWQDATHISYGVLTVGLVTPMAKLEVSWFNGREPDENRYDLDLRAPDSFSVRLSANPTARVSAQVSYGYLKSPEALAPDVSVHRLTASATYHAPFGSSGFWATTAVFGRNVEGEEPPSDSFLLESSLDLDGHHAVFGRAEYVRKTGHDLVLPESLAHSLFGVGSLVLGYVYSFGPFGPVRPGVGVRGALNVIPEGLEPFYGSRTPLGGMVYVRLVSAGSHP